MGPMVGVGRHREKRKGVEGRRRVLQARLLSVLIRERALVEIEGLLDVQGRCREHLVREEATRVSIRW